MLKLNEDQSKERDAAIKQLKAECASKAAELKAFNKRLATLLRSNR